jgi:phage terminase large subunit-like protein
MEWSTACPDWERRILARESLVPLAPLFPQEAEESLAYLRQLRLKDVGGVPTMGEVCRPWIMDFVAAIFGAYDADTGRRLINEFFLLISKKNGKSTTAAGIMLTALLRNWREEAEFLILAPTVEVANAAFKPAASMVREDEELSALLEVRDYQRMIRHTGTRATLRVIAADAETVAGNKATGVLIDELWLFGKRANADSMLIEATGGLASRPEGFVIYLSTQSDEPPAGVFRSKLQYARDVRDGKVQDRKFLPVLYEFPQALIDDGRYKDKSYFYVTNPNLGASVDVEFIEGKFDKAVQGSESLQDVLAKHLNVEIGLNLRSDRWAGADFWEAAGIALTLDELLERCEVAVIGIDGGGLDDLLGFAVIGRETGTGKWLSWCHAWAHKIVLERRKDVASLLRDFEAAGELTIVEMPGDDVRGVADVVCKVRDAGLLPAKNAIGVDAAGITDIVDALVADDRRIQLDQIVAVSQGWKLNGAIKTSERKVAGKELLHATQALMAWCVGNARIEDRGNAISVTKQASGKAKIDPLMALFDAVSLMALNPPSAISVYEERGVLSV